MSNTIYIEDFSEINELLREINTRRGRERTKISFKCCKCGKETRMSLSRFLCRNELICKECKTKMTSLEIYGVEYPTQSEEFKEKRKRTNIERYGVEHVLQIKAVREKAKRTNLKRYGVDHPSKCKEVIEKIKSTNLERHGVEHALQSKEFKEKAKRTNLKRHGVEYAIQNKELKDKAKRTNLKRYGVEYSLQNKVVREKAKNTCIKLFGVENPSQNPEIHKKIFSHRKEKLGGYLSKTEKKFAEMLTNRKINFEYDFHYNGKSWDFKVGDILVEIDGEYNHGLLSDSDGKHVQGQLDYERPKLAEPYKLLIIDSKNIKNGVDELLAMMNIDYEQWIQDIKDSLPKEFPYLLFDDKRMKNDWNKLCTYNYNKKGQRLGQSIINNFHKSIWTSHIGNLPSPVEAWSNKELLDKCVRNRFIYKSALSSQPIAYGFNVCKIAPKVSVFNPSLARHLVETYLGDFAEIFDPFSGFSGRMLGVCSLGKKYIGQDISETAIKESEEIKNFLGLDADLYCKDVLNSYGEYDCLFTCSPYGLKEIWGDDIENKSCDEWIDECLKRFKCKKYLFIVDSTEKYKDNIVETIENNSHFRKNKEYVVLID